MPLLRYKIITQNIQTNYQMLSDTFCFKNGISKSMTLKEHLLSLVQAKLDFYRSLPVKVLHCNPRHVEALDYATKLGDIQFCNKILEAHITENPTEYNQMQALLREILQQTSQNKQIELMKKIIWTPPKLDLLFNSVLYSEYTCEVLIHHRNKVIIEPPFTDGKIDNLIKESGAKKGYFITNGTNWIFIYYSLIEISSAGQPLQHYRNGQHFHFVSNFSNPNINSIKLKDTFLKGSRISNKTHMEITELPPFYIPYVCNNGITEYISG